MRSVDVFSDASGGRRGFAGAYIVGRGNEPVQIDLGDCKTSVEAELEASLSGLMAAQREHPRGITVVIHSDLACVARLLEKGKTEAAKSLFAAVQGGNVTVLTDAREFNEYRSCHRHARLAAGIYGKKHPNRTKKPKLSPPTLERMRLLHEALSRHTTGVSEMRLAQETGLGLNVVHKLMRRLESANEAYCERPDSVVGYCDIRQWLWHNHNATLCRTA